MFIFFKSTKNMQRAKGDAVGWNFDFLEREEAPSLKDYGRSNCRFSTEHEVKLFYGARATRGH